MPIQDIEKKSKRISKKSCLLTIVILILIIMFFSIIFALIHVGNTNMLYGIKIGEVEVSGLTKEQAKQKLEQWYEQTVLKEITIEYKELKETINIETLNPKMQIEEAINQAYKIGRTGNIIQNNYTILMAMLWTKQIPIEIAIDEQQLEKKIEEISAKLPGAIIQNNYYIEDNHLIIKKGTSGIQIKEKDLIEKIKEQLIKQDKHITIPIEQVMPKAIDIEKIHEEIYKEAQDAYVSENPVEVHPHVDGIDFAISIEEAKELLQEDKEEYVIPLKITIPEKTTEKLGEEAFPTVLGEYTTIYDVSNKNRSINLELASDKINGTIVLPGETFSYNKTVGERTIAQGYKEAAIYSGGKVVDGIGGGICQLSSTLYNTVLYANLEIISRTNHRFLTSYVPTGRDATVSWGTIDFKFKNTRTYPIKIVSSVKNGVVKIGIYGIQEEKEYQVTIQSTVTETIPYTTNYIEDDTLEKGNQVIEQKGANGAKSVTYKIVTYHGIEVSRTVLSNDTYSPLEKIIRKGTKEEKPNTENSIP
ncbi:MAG: VanW family protein [Clostridia bacterium]